MKKPPVQSKLKDSTKTASKTPSKTTYARISNFYPLYGENNDQVDRIQRVQAAAFQKVLPRYRLSTSETRDQGTGPMLEEVATARAPVLSRPGKKQSIKPTQNAINPLRNKPTAKHPWKGKHIDLYA